MRARGVRREAVARWASTLGWRLLGIGVLWWALIEGDISVAHYGVALVPIAVAASLALNPPRPRSRGPRPRRIRAAVALLGWLLWRSFTGGLDVARRCLNRPGDVEPEGLDYHLRLPPGFGRVLFVDLLSLMPGTLSADLDGDVLHVHVLHIELPARELATELEDRVHRVVG